MKVFSCALHGPSSLWLPLQERERGRVPGGPSGWLGVASCASWLSAATALCTCAGCRTRYEGSLSYVTGCPGRRSGFAARSAEVLKGLLAGERHHRGPAPKLLHSPLKRIAR